MKNCITQYYSILNKYLFVINEGLKKLGLWNSSYLILYKTSSSKSIIIEAINDFDYDIFMTRLYIRPCAGLAV